jgi:hypothetical protein
VPKVLNKTTLIFNTKTADWIKFEKILSEKINTYKSEVSEIRSEEQLNRFINDFELDLKHICERTMKLYSSDRNPHSNTNKWWSEELTIARRQTNSARRRFQRCQTDRRTQLHNEYLEKRSIYKKLITDQKMKTWNQFITESTRDNTWGLIYKISKNKLNFEKVNELKASDGSLITESKKIAQTLLDSLFPKDSTDNESEIQRSIRENISSEYNNNNIDLMFSEQEVTYCVIAQNPKKSSGEDEFTADIIKTVHKTDPAFLTNLYNKCFELIVFP